MSCPSCFSGGVTSSKPTGTEETIHGRPTYVAKPEEGVTPKGIVVFITDAFGWEFVNNRVLCDIYAKKGGFLVYCPDFMDGASLDPSALGLFDTMMNPAPSWFAALTTKPPAIAQILVKAIPWKTKTKFSVTYPRVVDYIQKLRTTEPPFPTKNLKIGVAGFCWGAKHCTLLSHDDPSLHVKRHASQDGAETPTSLIDCSFQAHPSSLEIPSDADAIKKPTSVCVGDVDAVLKKPDAEKMKAILEAKGSDHEMEILPGAKHGFAIRAHPEDEEEMKQAQVAEDKAIAWFTRWFV